MPEEKYLERILTVAVLHKLVLRKFTLLQLMLIYGFIQIQSLLWLLLRQIIRCIKTFLLFLKSKFTIIQNAARQEEGSDFWEGGAVEPQEILQDLIQIMHPEIAPKGRELKYYIPLK